MGPGELGALGMRAAVLTVSTSKASGEGSDQSGPALAALAESIGAEVAIREIAPDDQAQIEQLLRRWSDDAGCELILTTGGTGCSPSDRTPEATRAVIEREVPGIAEAMRAASRSHTKHWMLSRAVAGIRGRTLIVNFPGNPKSIAEAGDAIAAALPHAVELIAGRSAH